MKNFAQGTKIKAILPGIFLGMLCFFLTFLIFLTFANQSLQAQQVPQSRQRQQSLQPMSREQLNQEISSLFRRSSQGRQRFDSLSLPAAAQKCATPLLKQALRHWELLDPENQFILHRPINRPSNRGDYYYGDGVAVWSHTRTSPPGHFRLYYTEDDHYGDAVEGSDGNKVTIPDYVKQFASYFEESWSYLTGRPPAGLGYRTPSGPIEVFILNIDAYGITSSDDKGLYIMVKNSYRGSEIKPNDNSKGISDLAGKEEGAMKVTATHEFFHVVQAGYDDWPTVPTEIADNTWWEENTAVWIEDEHYDDVNDYLNYLGWPYRDLNDNGQWNFTQWSGEPYFDIFGKKWTDIYRGDGWFDYPDDSLIARSPYNPDPDAPPPPQWKISNFDSFEYGGVIWPKFLSERFHQEIIRTIFEHARATHYDMLQAIDQSLKDPTGGGKSLDQAFIEFKLANLEQDYEEGARYPIPYHDDPSMASPQLNPLSCQYLILREPSSSGGAVRINFSNNTPINNTPQSDLVALAVPATSYASLPGVLPQFGTAQLITLDNSPETYYDFSFHDNPSFSKLVIIPINLSQDAIIFYTLTEQTLTSQPPAPEIIGSTWGIKDGYLSFQLTWKAAGESGKYQIWRSQQGDAYQTRIFQSIELNPSPKQDRYSYPDNDHSLDENKSYTYQLKFASSTGTSSSEVAVAPTPAGFPFHNLLAKHKTTSSNYAVEISFQVDPDIPVDPNIPSYQIERKTGGADPVTVKSKTQITSPPPAGGEDVIYDDGYQLRGNTVYTYTVTLYDAHDIPFHKDISIEIPGQVESSDENNGSSHGCFITAVTLATF